MSPPRGLSTVIIATGLAFAGGLSSLSFPPVFDSSSDLSVAFVKKFIGTALFDPGAIFVDSWGREAQFGRLTSELSPAMWDGPPYVLIAAIVVPYLLVSYLARHRSHMTGDRRRRRKTIAEGPGGEGGR